MNTAISVTVDFNPQLKSEVEVKSIDKNACEIKSLNSSVKQSPCNSMGKYYSQDTFTPQRERSQSSCVEKLSSWHCPKASDLNRICSRSSPAKKRVLSPRNGMTPSKRKKSFSPQKNKIYNYFVQTYGNKIEKTEECAEVENVSFFSSNIADSMNCSQYGSTNGIVKNNVGNHSSVCTSVHEVILISSDEEGDSPISVAKKDEETASWQTLGNIVDLCDEKPVIAVNMCNNLKQKTSYVKNLPVNLSNSPKSKYQESIDSVIYIISSDEEDNHCSSYDAGDVIVPESKHFKESLMEKDYNDDDDDDDDDDDSISVISYQPGVLSRKENCFKEDTDTLSLDVEILETNNCDLSACANQLPNKRISSEESTESEERLFGSPLPPYVSDLETSSQLDDLHSTVAFMAPLEDNENVRDSLLEMQDSITTDSSVSSAPHLCDDNASMHFTPTEENDHVALCKESSKSETNERTLSEYPENKEKPSVFEENENYSSEISSLSPIVSDKSISTFDIVSQCNGREICEKENEDETASTEKVDNKLCPRIRIISPSAMRVCRVQAEVLLSKLYQPWIDLGSDEVPECCIMGPDVCNSSHGKKELCPEEADYYDELLPLRMDCGTSAVDLLQSRLDFLVYPTTPIVQNLLFGCMDLWVEGVTDVLCWLRQLLRLHPPCAFGMLDYYRKVLFNPVKDMRAPEGTFWFCVTKIEEAMNAVERQSIENNAAAKTSGDEQVSSDFVEKFLEDANPLLPSEKEMDDIQHSDKLKQLFDTLDYLVRIMEADLNMGLLKNISNLKRYTCKTGRPLIAVALWGPHGTVGNVNTKCRHLMKMYLRIFESYYDNGYHLRFMRLISLMAGVTYASERNSVPPEYPNIKSNCKDLANTFASIMMGSALNMMEVRLILESSRPDWFRICVCSNLLEKLYGRNMELSLKPTVSLLKSLNALNQDYPSDEEIAKTLLAEPDTIKDTSKDSEELPLNYVKQATKKDKKGETRLHIACRRNYVQEVERLLNVPGISVNEKDHMGWTPLHEGAFHGNLECVKRLLNFRTPSGGPAVDLQTRNKSGITPLMDAVSQNHLEVASVLLQYGGEKLLSDTNNEGLSAWHLTCSEEMICVLSSAQDHGQEYDLTIPRTLYIKLAVLTPLAIIYYIKFSEVMRIVHYLKCKTELTRDGASLIKFHPIGFKQDYLEFGKLQTFLKETLNNHNKLLDSLTSYT